MGGCIDALGLRQCFPDDRIFTVDDTMPFAKPQAEAFQKVLDKVGSKADRTIMFEDSMKNVRSCKAMGMHTVLLDESIATGSAGGEAALLSDNACRKDPTMDVAIEKVEQLIG